MQKSLINSADRDLVDTICECVLNCLNGNVNLKETDKLQLAKYKNHLRKLIQKKHTSLKKKKQVLVQKGAGFLPIILSAVLSLLQ